MTLNEWAASVEADYRDIARWLDVHETTAWRWIRHITIPNARAIMLIENMTEGAVTMQDWHPENAREED